jgi:hypothetical protein
MRCRITPTPVTAPARLLCSRMGSAACSSRLGSLARGRAACSVARPKASRACRRCAVRVRARVSESCPGVQAQRRAEVRPSDSSLCAAGWRRHRCPRDAQFLDSRSEMWSALAMSSAGRSCLVTTGRGQVALANDVAAAKRRPRPWPGPACRLPAAMRRLGYGRPRSVARFSGLALVPSSVLAPRARLTPFRFFRTFSSRCRQ